MSVYLLEVCSSVPKLAVTNYVDPSALEGDSLVHHRLNSKWCPDGQLPQRNGSVCCLPVACHNGEEIKTCSANGTVDQCVKCPSGYIQPNNVSSLNMDEASCFILTKAHNQCMSEDFKPAQLPADNIWQCVCKAEHCLVEGSAYTCELLAIVCGLDQQLNSSTKACEQCPWYAFKKETGCYSCIVNITLLRLGKTVTLDHSVTTMSTVLTSVSDEATPLINIVAKNITYNYKFIWITAAVLLLVTITVFLVVLLKQDVTKKCASRLLSPSQRSAVLTSTSARAPETVALLQPPTAPAPETVVLFQHSTASAPENQVLSNQSTQINASELTSVLRIPGPSGSEAISVGKDISIKQNANDGYSSNVHKHLSSDVVPLGNHHHPREQVDQCIQVTCSSLSPLYNNGTCHSNKINTMCPMSPRNIFGEQEPLRVDTSLYITSTEPMRRAETHLPTTQDNFVLESILNNSSVSPLGSIASYPTLHQSSRCWDINESNVHCTSVETQNSLSADVAQGSYAQDQLNVENEIDDRQGGDGVTNCESVNPLSFVFNQFESRISEIDNNMVHDSNCKIQSVLPLLRERPEGQSLSKATTNVGQGVPQSDLHNTFRKQIVTGEETSKKTVDDEPTFTKTIDATSVKAKANLDEFEESTGNLENAVYILDLDDQKHVDSLLEHEESISMPEAGRSESFELASVSINNDSFEVDFQANGSSSINNTPTTELVQSNDIEEVCSADLNEDTP